MLAWGGVGVLLSFLEMGQLSEGAGLTSLSPGPRVPWATVSWFVANPAFCGGLFTTPPCPPSALTLGPQLLPSSGF